MDRKDVADEPIYNQGDSDKDKKLNVPSYPLVKLADIPEDTKQDILDLVTGTLERYIPDVSVASKQIKERMDRLYGHGWHVIIGEHFAFDVAYQTNHLLYMFYGGNFGVLLWKCS